VLNCPHSKGKYAFSESEIGVMLGNIGASGDAGAEQVYYASLLFKD